MQMTGFKPWMPTKGEQLSDAFLLLSHSQVALRVDVAEVRVHYAAVERLLLICFLLSSRVASNVCGPVLSTGLTIQVRGHPSRWLRMQRVLALL